VLLGYLGVTEDIKSASAAPVTGSALICPRVGLEPGSGLANKVALALAGPQWQNH
jgi:hypothetical protein